MKSMATSIIYVLALSLTTTTLLFTGSNACPRDPSMAIAAACHQVSGTVLDLCTKTLHAAFENSEVSEYAIIASGATLHSCQETERNGKQLLQNPSLPKELRAPYSHCMDTYGMAEKKIQAIGAALGNCWFPTFKHDCADAAAAIDDCAHSLQPVDPSSALYKMVLADRDLTTLTCSLALLGVAKQWN